jgi:ATP-dependent helicase/nuclease subunit A
LGEVDQEADACGGSRRGLGVRAEGPLPGDYLARERAATDFTANLVVTAGAGTGKTSLLVERVLNAVGSGRAPLSAIAAITFTDKAAGELRERVALGLEQLRAMSRGEGIHERPTEAVRSHGHLVSRLGIAPELVAERALRGLIDLDRASITTIHGFCADILRSHPLESGVPPGFAVDRGTATIPIVDDAWELFLQEELGLGGRNRPRWARVLEVLSLGDARSIARGLVRGAVPDDLLAGRYAAADLGAALSSDARDLGARLSSLRADVPRLTGAPSAFLSELCAALNALSEGRLADVAAWIARSKRLTEGDLPEFKSMNVSVAEAAPLVAESKRALRLLRVVRDADDELAEAVYEAVAPFARRVREALVRRGIVDFDALLVRTRDLLRDRPAARRAVRRRFRLILVDEFQDTDPIQYEIVFFLAEADPGTVFDPYAASLEPGRLFIVGDVKQSIYRFRGADFAAYRRAIDRVLSQKGQALVLKSNFRSEESIVQAVNVLFSAPGTAWRPSPTLSEYEPIAAERPRSEGPSVTVGTVAPGGRGLASDRRRAEGLAIAAEIARITGPRAAYRFGDVLVLLRGFSDVALYLRAFREAGIPFVVSGGREFRERTEIAQAMAVLRAVADTDDAVALLAFLRSPAGGVPDAELRTHAESGGAWGAGATADERSCPSFAAALDRLRRLREAAAGRPVSDAIRRVFERSGLVELGALAFEGAQRIANLEKLARTAADLARDGRHGVLETLDALDEVFEAEPEGDSPLADEAADAVRVMTIHKAKGLESPVVVLADTAAGRKSGGGTETWDVDVVRRRNGQGIGISGPRMKNGAALLREFEDGDHEAAEDLRLLYVALTRARDHLLVLGGPPDTRSPWIDALRAWGYDAGNPPDDGVRLAQGLVLHRRLEPVETAGGRRSAPPTGAPDAVMRYGAAVSRAADEATPKFRSPSGLEDFAAEFDDVDATVARGLPRPLARAVGLAVHARLERFAVADLAAADELAPEANAILREFAASPLASRLATLEVLGREVPLLFEEDRRTRWSGTIDLLYREPDGTIVVADYKTDASLDGALERHREQLRVYAEGVRRAIPGSRVRAELWMLRHGAVIAEPSAPTPPGALAR